MQISEFKGIQQYHDGRPVSDYCNMIPLGNSVIDRYGEEYIKAKTSTYFTGPVLETFVDSLGNIYIAMSTTVVKTSLVEEGGEIKYTTPEAILGEVTGYNPGKHPVTFVESSTKPSQVYCCDGKNVWYWNTTDVQIPIQQIDPVFVDRYVAFKPIKLPLFKDIDSLMVGGISLREWISTHLESDSDSPGTYVGWWPDYDDFSGSNPTVIDSIAWFDNRLVLVEKVNNTVWLSAVDPSRWTVPTHTIASSEHDYLYPRLPWQVVSSEDDSLYDEMFPNYYASTASSANIQEVAAFSGQLYFLNDTSIEVWSATGNDDNPIQHNSQNTLYYGGRSPVIINDTLYLICKGAIQNDFIAAINQSGAITHVSNDEIERMLLPKPFRIRPLAVRDQSMIVVYTDEGYRNGYAITKHGFWWRYWNDYNFAIAWSVVNFNGTQVGVDRWGGLAIATESNRKYLNGRPIPRTICGGWIQFTGRKILREMEIICDTGVYLDPNQDRSQLFLRVSFDRGITYGPYLYRKLGASGMNNRVMIWRNCGSGNSMLLHFGTSDNVRFQIYGLRFELV